MFTQLKWPWHCERRCESVSTSRKHNVILLAGDRMVAAHCEAAVRKYRDDPFNNEDIIWRKKDSGALIDGTLMTSCTNIQRPLDSDVIEAEDCVNGTLMPRAFLPGEGVANYTVIHRIFARYGKLFPLDRDTDAARFPFETDITIYNRTKLLINTEACVNTLRYECTDFYLDHRRDGRNYSANDRFPCFYTPKHGDFVTAR